MAAMSGRRLVKWLVWFLVIDLIAAVVVYVSYNRFREHRFDKLIAEVAAQYGVDPCLVKAVIWRETRFKPHDVGRAGEVGLMQVLPDTAQDWADAVGRRDFSRSHLFDPRTNIEAGAWYLRRGLDYWKACDEPLPFAIAEYNAGRGNVRKWIQPGYEHDAAGFIESIGFASTKRYVQAVLERYEQYKQSGEFGVTATPSIPETAPPDTGSLTDTATMSESR
jgi:soluble lytic murein transglycosylase